MLLNFLFNEKGKIRRLFGNPDLAAPTLLVLLGVAFFSDFLFSSKNLYFRDILNFHYPLRKVLIDSYARGEFPLWNPFIYLGQPMLANPNYMAFYPTNLLHLIFSFNYAFKLHFVIHPLLGGLGIYFLQRRLGIRAAAALGGSLAYQFSGTVLSFLNLYNIVPAVALMPWIGWAFLGAIEANRLRRSLLFGALLALQIIAFEPLVFQCTVLFLAGLCLYWTLESQDRRRCLLVMCRVGLLGLMFALGLASVQVIPTLELLPLSARGGGFDLVDLTSWSMHPMDLLNTLIPNFFGYYYAMGYATSWGESFHQGREGYLVSFFLGTTVLLMACLSFAAPRRRLQWILGALFLLSVCLALGKFDPLYNWLVMHVPLFRLGRYPAKYFLLATLACSLLCSKGYEVLFALGGGGGRKNRRVLGVGVCGLLVSLVLLGAFIFCSRDPLILESWIRKEVDMGLAQAKDFHAISAQLVRSILASGVFLLATSALILASHLRRRSGTFLVALGLILPAAELLPANLRLSPLISNADVKYVPEINKYLELNGPKEPHRIFPPTSTTLHPMPDLQIRAPNRAAAWLTLFYRRSGQPFYGIMEGIQYSLDRSVDQLNTKDSEELWEAFLRLPEREALTLLQKLNTLIILSLDTKDDRRVQLERTFDTHSNVQLMLYLLKNAAPRAYFASGAHYAPSHEAALEMYLRPEFCSNDTVVLEDPQGSDRPGESGAGSAEVLEYQAKRVLCAVQAQIPGYLVLLDTYYPGWHAYVDGSEADIVRANFAFRAVEVSPGKHSVEFRYRPRSFQFGLVASAVTLLAALVSPVVLRRSDKVHTQ